MRGANICALNFGLFFTLGAVEFLTQPPHQKGGVQNQMSQGDIDEKSND